MPPKPARRHSPITRAGFASLKAAQSSALPKSRFHKGGLRTRGPAPTMRASIDEPMK
jgi:hypothetical protein